MFSGLDSAVDLVGNESMIQNLFRTGPCIWVLLGLSSVACISVERLGAKPVLLYSRYFNAKGESRYLPDGTYATALQKLTVDYEVRVHDKPLNKETLHDVRVLLISNPSDSAVGNNPPPPHVTPEDMEHLRNYVESGGGLILMGNQEDHNLETIDMNRLLKSFGMQWVNRYTDAKGLEIPESTPVIGGLKWGYYTGNLVELDIEHSARPFALVTNDGSKPLGGDRNQEGILMAASYPGQGRVVLATDAGWINQSVLEGKGLGNNVIADDDNWEIFSRLCRWASGVRFTKIQLSDQYYCDGIASGDFNHDGKRDVVAGPFWYEGPEFTRAHAFYPPNAWPREASPSDSMFSFVHDINGDGWEDILVLGRVHLHQAFWYENPAGKSGLWTKHFAFHRIKGESPAFLDMDGDGRPELLTHTETYWGWVAPDWNQPASPWQFTAISEKGAWKQFYHGTGAGDVNGDGRLDLLLNEGWYEQPRIAGTRSAWRKHDYLMHEKGGAQIHAYDLDTDGDNDLISSLDAHGWGLAWFEQVRDNESIRFEKRLIMDDRNREDEFGIAFSQPHALDLADINGDGLKDILTGKRMWAHGPDGDVEPNADPVVCWFELRKSHSGIPYFMPHLVDKASGTGVQIRAEDVNQDRKTDILTASKLGAFLFIQE